MVLGVPHLGFFFVVIVNVFNGGNSRGWSLIIELFFFWKGRRGIGLLSVQGQFFGFK